jgi:hypothetical protein
VLFGREMSCDDKHGVAAAHEVRIEPHVTAGSGSTERTLRAARADEVFRLAEVSVLMPVRSVLRLDGAAADEFKHAVPPVRGRRIAITMRRVDPELDQRAAEAERKATSEQQRILRKRQLKAAKRMSRQQARGVVQAETADESCEGESLVHRALG